MPVTYSTANDGTLYPVYSGASASEEVNQFAHIEVRGRVVDPAIQQEVRRSLQFQTKRDELERQGLSPHNASVQAWAVIMPGPFPGVATLPGGLPFHATPLAHEYVPWLSIFSWFAIVLAVIAGWITLLRRGKRTLQLSKSWRWFGMWAGFEACFFLFYRLMPRLQNNGSIGQAFFSAFPSHVSDELTVDRADSTFFYLTLMITIVSVLCSWIAKSAVRRKSCS